MASVIRNLLRGGTDGPRDGVVQHTVGNALVLHAQDSISAEAQSLALTVVEDAENDVVVLDLGPGLPISSWESMAGVLPRRRRGIRLMACGEHRYAVAMAGQWLSERLNRTVIAPDGELVRGAAGGLFVHSTPGSGWVRFRPGKPPAWDSKRYPAPLWDQAATEQRASSSTGEIEPLPGGVWIHDVRAPEIIGEHRKRLVADVPCQPEVMTVLLGCPGTAPLSLDDVVRFWRELDDETRARARFVRYGDVRLPEGEAFGQALADLLGTGVICYTGVPVGAPGKFEIRTVRDDGVLGWPPFTLELAYAPRAHPNSKARRPTVVSHRAPLAWTEEVTPRVYWYAPDAVIEVVQAGLWVRPTEEPQNAERVRATPLDPEGSTLVFDDTTTERTARMQELAEDLAARVEASIGQETALYPASLLVPGHRPAGRAESVLRAVEPEPVPAPVVQATVEMPAPPSTTYFVPPAVEAVLVEPAPQVEAPVARQQIADSNRATRSYSRAELLPDSAAPAPSVPGARSTPVPVAPVEPVDAGRPESPVPSRPSEPFQPFVPVEPVAVEPPAAVEPPVAVEPPALVEPPAPVAPHAMPVTPTEPFRPAESLPEPAAVAPDDDITSRLAALVGPDDITSRLAALAGPDDISHRVAALTEPAAPPPAQPAPPVALPVTAVPSEPDDRPVTRLQPVPAASASALLPSKRSLDEERAWLRRTLSREFDTMASSVSRLMSEHPGLQGSGAISAADILADSVAVRLYLSGRGAGIDAGLRSGAAGPHVPFARCAVAGLSRLPSYRGTTVYRTSPDAAEWSQYQDRRLVTDWSFVNVLTGPCESQQGDTDVLVWSMTARRTSVLEPEGDERVEDRVLFLPGTHFKVLELRQPSGDDRGAILMREIGTNEIGTDGRVAADRVSLDELAVTSLRRSVERWAGAEPRHRVGAGSTGRFGTLPGLDRRPARAEVSGR
jgi:hypothetical protein